MAAVSLEHTLEALRAFPTLAKMEDTFGDYDGQWGTLRKLEKAFEELEVLGTEVDPDLRNRRTELMTLARDVYGCETENSFEEHIRSKELYPDSAECDGDLLIGAVRTAGQYLAKLEPDRVDNTGNNIFVDGDLDGTLSTSLDELDSAPRYSQRRGTFSGNYRELRRLEASYEAHLAEADTRGRQDRRRIEEGLRGTRYQIAELAMDVLNAEMGRLFSTCEEFNPDLAEAAARTVCQYWDLIHPDVKVSRGGNIFEEE